MNKDQLAFATYIRARIEDALEELLDREFDQALKGTGSATQPVGLLAQVGREAKQRADGG